MVLGKLLTLALGRMRRAGLAAGGAALLGAMLCTSQAAAAADDPSDDVPQPGERSRAPREADDDVERVTLTVNPLGFALQRYGGNVEVMVARHHALTGNIHVQSVPAWLVRSLSGRSEVADDPGASVGGEIGYRAYTGRRGADGLFAGLSFVSTPLAYPRLASDLSAVELTRFQANGAAIDIGAQLITSSGFTFGGGLGAMVLAYTFPDDPRRVSIGIEPHVFPRLLLAAGWSF